MTSRELQTSGCFEDVEGRRTFAYHILTAAHAAVEEYYWLSGGRSIQGEGSEHFVSFEIAKAMVRRRAKISVPFYDDAGKQTRKVFSADSAILEAGGQLIFGEGGGQRIDVVLCTESAGEGRDPSEAFFAIEFKRYFSESHRDIRKLGGILENHNRNRWCLLSGASVSFYQHREGSKQFQERLVGALENLSSNINLRAYWLSRTNPALVSDRHALDDSFQELTACAVFIETPR